LFGVEYIKTLEISEALQRHRGTMSDNDAGLKDARDQLNLILSFFSRVDAKLSTVLAIDTGMLAALSASLPAVGKMTGWMAVSPVLASGLLIASYVYLYRGGFPNVKGGHSSAIYFKEIAKRTEATFIEEYCRHTAESLRQDVLGQVWRNSEILTEKFRCLKVAFICMAIGVLPWALSLATFALAKANVQVVVPQP
jgi:hypothetical protein